jgi:predicted Zn finger-like uncharacterized protein
MFVLLNCPGCTRPLKVAGSLAGKPARCSACGRTFIAPPATNDSKFLLLQCPGCARQLKVADAAAGKAGRCSACGRTFTASPVAPPPEEVVPVLDLT